MPYRRFIALVILVAFVSTTSLFISTRSSDDLTLEQRIDEYIMTYVDVGRFSGSALVSREGEILFEKGYGMANLEHDVPNTPDTVFRIGRLTQAFTAAAILQLQERGLLSVDDPISRFMPDYPRGDEITIHHLLSHSSGIPKIFSFEDKREHMVIEIPATEVIDIFKDEPLKFTPGTEGLSSHANYILLGHIIELVTGQSYIAYMQKNIWYPLRMWDTGYDDRKMIVENRASGYTLGVSGIWLWNADYQNMSVYLASIGLYSTVHDLYLWDQALYSNSILNQDSLESMLASYFEVFQIHGMGYGWIMTEGEWGMEACMPGGTKGFRSIFHRFIDQETSIIILSNLQEANLQDLLLGIGEIMFYDQ